MNPLPPVTLHTLLGNHANVLALKQGRIASPLLRFDFADVAVPNRAFKRAVRDLEFDFCELAIVTFLQAHERGIPLVMLPITLVGRFQHPFILYNPARGRMAPSDLPGRRVGVRASSQTTVTWVRGVLMHDYGVDLGKVRWLSFEDAHVADCPDPAGFERAPEGKELLQMLADGEIDAGVVAEKDLNDARLAQLIPDAQAAGLRWHARHGAVHVNHMPVVTAALLRERPDAVRELIRLLAAARAAASLPGSGINMLPFGVEDCRPSLEILIRYCVDQQLIERAPGMDALFGGAIKELMQGV